VAVPGRAQRAEQLRPDPAARSTTPSAASEAANMPAARIGPTVCELDGPMPTLKSSKALIVTSGLLPLI
jgi:hypothetical protein